MMRILFLLALCLSTTVAVAGDRDEVMSDCFHSDDAGTKVTACQTVIDALPDVPRNSKPLLRAHNTLGLALCDVHRSEEAIPHFEWVLRHNHSIAGYFDNYSRALRDAGRMNDAMRAENQAIRMAPNYAFVYVGKAKILEGQGNAQGAFDVLASAFQYGNDAGLYEYRGKLLGQLQRFEEANQDFERAFALQPDRYHVYKTRGEMEAAEGKIGAAIADLNRYRGDEIDTVHDEIATLVDQQEKSVDHTKPIEPSTLTVTPGQSAIADAQKAAQEADERAKTAEAEAQAMRDLEAATAREKAAQNEKDRVAKEQAEADKAAQAEKERLAKAEIEAKRQEDARRKAEIEPVNVLRRGYATYIVVKRCHEQRDGYSAVWINDVEADRAKKEIATIESKLNADNALNTDEVWKQANGIVDSAAKVLDEGTCHMALSDEDDLFKKIDPNAAMTHKDF